MDSTKQEIHILIKNSTLQRLENHYKETKNQGKATTFSRFIENALIFYLTEKGATE